MNRKSGAPGKRRRAEVRSGSRPAAAGATADGVIVRSQASFDSQPSRVLSA